MIVRSGHSARYRCFAASQNVELFQMIEQPKLSVQTLFINEAKFDSSAAEDIRTDEDESLLVAEFGPFYDCDCQGGSQLSAACVVSY